jgi:8-oxo-dGTP diphosphatase/(d)CTP diphosphatase
MTAYVSGDSPMKKAPEAVVGVIRREGRVLVIQRGPDVRMTGYWSPPTGRIEAGESQAQAVIRGMREELGLEVRPLAKVWESRTDDGRFLLQWWLLEENGAEITLNLGEVSQAVWVNTQEFLKLDPTFRGGREFFQNVLNSIAGARR